MSKRYLFFVSISYAYPILRPLQDEIWRRGDEVSWFIEEPCPVLLEKDERQLKTIQEVIKYNPIAIFAPGNYIYDFLPGVKVSLFHGYPINKRRTKFDDHFKIRGGFDIYCTQGESSTSIFKELERKHKHFKVYETGWSRVDSFFSSKEAIQPRGSEEPTIFVTSTFSKRVSSLHRFYPIIKDLAQKRSWNWIITLHPKLQDKKLIEKYKLLALENSNVTFLPTTKGIESFYNTDVMLCDSSSIIIEYMLFNKPVVTYNNTSPGKHLINVTELNDIEQTLEKALTYPKELMKEISLYTLKHESHRDGQNSARILDAVDDFIKNYEGRIKRKPINLFRRFKSRWKKNFWR